MTPMKLPCDVHVVAIVLPYGSHMFAMELSLDSHGINVWLDGSRSISFSKHLNSRSVGLHTASWTNYPAGCQAASPDIHLLNKHIYALPFNTIRLPCDAHGAAMWWPCAGHTIDTGLRYVCHGSAIRLAQVYNKRAIELTCYYHVMAMGLP